MGSKAPPTGGRKAQQRRRLVRHVIYVLNLMLGVATHSCELAAFTSYWVVPGSLVMTDARIEREVGAMWPTYFPSPLECPVPLPEPPARSLYLNVS